MNLLAIAGGVVLLLVLLGVMFVLARRRRAAASDELAGEEGDYEHYDDEDDDFLAGATDEVDDGGDLDLDFDEQDAGGPAEAAQDPLEEVDVYTAYGRHAEAVTFLKNEIKKAPDRADLKIRLLEVITEMRDLDTFEREAAAFAGDAQVDARAADLRAQLGGGASAPVADTSTDEPSLDDLEFDLAADMEPQRPSADEPLEFESAAGSDDTLSLDGGDDEGFELDMDLDEAPAEPEQSLDEVSDDEEISLDFEEEPEPEVDAAKQQELDDALNVAPALSLDDGPGSQSAEEDIDFGEIELADASDEFTEAAETPAAAPQATIVRRCSLEKRTSRPVADPNAAPICTIGPSRPAEPPELMQAAEAAALITTTAGRCRRRA